jgi:spore protease
MSNFIYSDLAIESAILQSPDKTEHPEIAEYDFGFAKLTELKISDDKLSKKHGRPMGRYVTITTEQIWSLCETELDALSSLIESELHKMIGELVPNKESRDIAILVVGLGNSDITPDAIGPQTTARLTVTRHIEKLDPHLFSRLKRCNVSAFVPGVLAQTGIETLELIQGVVTTTSPDVVIAIDALAARSTQRLGRTVQISDAGISPGSGIGNMRRDISHETLGAPVIAVGVPTVVDSATLVYDALEAAYIKNIPNEILDALDNNRSFFVTPKECDVLCQSVSDLLAEALEKTFAL